MGERIPGLPAKPNWLVIGGITVAAGLIGAVVSVSIADEQQPAGASSALPVASITPRPPTIEEELDLQGDLQEAVALMRGRFSNAQGQHRDRSAEVFARWLSRHLDFKQFDLLPSTSWSLVSKDPALERGKKICARGMITQIRVNRTDWVRNEVILQLPSGEHLTAIAVGSSGNLLDRSSARLCGIATGTWYFNNVAGGTTPSVHVVGAFDLPENVQAVR